MEHQRSKWQTHPIHTEILHFGVHILADVNVAFRVAQEKRCRGFRWLRAWLEHDFRVTEAFDANREDVSAGELVVLGLEQHFRQRKRLPPTVMNLVSSGSFVGLGLEQNFRATDAFAANSDDIRVWELVGLWAGTAPHNGSVWRQE